MPFGHESFAGDVPTGMHICLSEACDLRARGLFGRGGLRNGGLMLGRSGRFYRRGFSLFFRHLRLFGFIRFFGVVPEFGAEEV